MQIPDRNVLRIYKEENVREEEHYEQEEQDEDKKKEDGKEEEEEEGWREKIVAVASSVKGQTKRQTKSVKWLKVGKFAR